MDESASEGREIPKGRCISMRQEGAWAGREDGGHARSPRRQATVADGVDAAVDAVKGAVLHAPSDCAVADGEREKLGA